MTHAIFIFLLALVSIIAMLLPATPHTCMLRSVHIDTYYS